MRRQVKYFLRRFIALFCGSLAASCIATTHYVDMNSANPAAPYTSWSTAATNIQDAVNSASSGDLVLVTNGVYCGGGQVVSGSTTNCVYINSGITVQSASGPSVTVIESYPFADSTNGSTRCAYLESGSTISGFTLMNGAANGDSGGGVYCQSGTSTVLNCIVESNTASSGGGVYCYYANAFCSNCQIVFNSAVNGGGGFCCSYDHCVISSNVASINGGGLYLASFQTPGDLNNCVVAGNTAVSAAGIYIYDGSAFLNNCTIVGNASQLPGGIEDNFGPVALTNCIVYYNTSHGSYPPGSDIEGTTNVAFCCTPLTNGLGPNNITVPPGFVNMDGGDFQLAQWSACIDAGANDAVASATDLGGSTRIVGGNVDIGAYEYQDQSTQTIHFVSLQSQNPVPPYSNWLNAATNIQDAIDASDPGDVVVVSNGVYNVGGRATFGPVTNRVVVNVPITVQALSGTALTTIQGNFPEIRCAYLTNGATMIGFTLTNGYAYSGDNASNEDGGGVWCESPSATLLSCVFAKNFVTGLGGGAYSGTLIDCIFIDNNALEGGGAYCGTLIGCTIANNYGGSGGGSFGATLIGCTLTGNYGRYGNGACFGVLSNCLVTDNGTPLYPGFGGGVCSNVLFSCILSSNFASAGGAAYASTLTDCTILGNNAINSGGGVYACILTNCTLTGNWATNGGGAAFGLLVDCTLTNNAAVNGGASASNILANCYIAYNAATNDGGGAFCATQYNCFIASNMAETFGGGACFGSLSNCIITNNFAFNGGGGYSNAMNNCTLTHNMATDDGGGVYGGTLNGCLLVTNMARFFGGGSFETALASCELFDNVAGPSSGGGGGTYGGALTDCIVSNNVGSGSSPLSVSYGGGASQAALTNCLIVQNHLLGEGEGAGAYDCYLENCTIALNSGTYAGIFGGGATNCIIYYNNGALSGNYPTNHLDTFQDCCTFPMPSQAGSFGNLTNAPLFVDTNGDFHLQPNSPCINSGDNQSVGPATDLDGNPRIAGGTVDIGAYEYQSPGSIISYAYLQQYGLPTDGSVDHADLDGTAFNVYQDWIAELNPTNPSSVLAMAPPQPANDNAGISVSWDSVTNVVYDLQRSTNLSALPAFSTIKTGIIGNAGATSYSDTSATNGVPYFYRVCVQ